MIRCETCGSVLDPAVTLWTAKEIDALRQAMQMSVREFGRYLGVSDRIVSNWTRRVSRPHTPRPVNQAALGTAYSRADAATRQRFAALLGTDSERPRLATEPGPSVEAI